MRFAVFGNSFQASKSAFASQLFSTLEQHGDSYIIDKDFYAFLTQEQHLDIHPAGVIDTPAFKADMVISLGGDGTFLKAARHVGAQQIPLLGINGGRLGFLSTISPQETEEMIALIHRGEYEVEERSLIEVCTQGGCLHEYPFALNEVAVLKHDTSSMITIRLTVGGENLVTYQADGLIVATPTGSTGYSLSVGGPVVSPQSGVFVLSPVAPHSLTARPVVVVRDEERVSIEIESRSRNFLLAIDGRSESCTDRTRITLQKAPYKLHMVKRKGQTFFETLRKKMMWGVDSRE